MVFNLLKSIFAEPEPQPRNRRHSVPEGTIVYAIGDIHGRIDLLMDLLRRIDDHWRTREGIDRATIVFLGDYIDRGEGSPAVLDRLISLQPRSGIDLVFLRGNHEQLMLDFLDDPAQARLWLEVGGDVTLKSYGIDYAGGMDIEELVRVSDALGAVLPPQHLDFLRKLRLSWSIGDYVFVHAGLRPGVPVQKQSARDILSIRREFTESRHDFGFRVVHGHTGVRDVAVFNNRIAVDTGAYFTGKLSAVALWEDQVSVISTVPG